MKELIKFLVLLAIGTILGGMLTGLGVYSIIKIIWFESSAVSVCHLWRTHVVN